MQAIRTRTAALTRAQARHMSAVPKFNSKSVLQSLMDNTSMPETPLNEEFPNTPAPTAPLANEGVTVTKTEQGINVVSTDNGEALTSVGVFVEAGSRYETLETSGMSHFLEGMAFKSTANRSEFRTVREMMKIGATMQAHAGRENMIYTADVLRQNVPAVMGTFGDIISSPAFKSYEVQDHAKAYAEDAAARAANPEFAVAEGIHEAAYFNNSLGMPQFAAEANLASFTPEALAEYHATFFKPERMVVSGVGVNHQELVDLTNEVFDHLTGEGPAAPAATPAQYTGGEARYHTKGDAGYANVVVAFETASWNSPDLVPMCVLQMLMGGGGSFSAGGPGKGMCSRLYERVLNKYGWVDSAQCVNWVYGDSALFGIHGSCHPQNVSELVNVFADQAQGMASAVNETELSRAKNQLKSQLVMQLESRAMNMEDMGRQFQTYQKVTSAAELCNQIDAVSAADIARVAKDMLAKPVSVAGHGDLSFLPRYEEIANKFKL